jgi:hypothetical protein
LTKYPTLPSGAFNLNNTNLTGGYFVDEGLAGASVSNSNLTGATFTGANLSGANLTNSNLKDANLSDADLANSNLSDANLAGANLAGANLRSANLNAVNVSGVTWGNTTCPDGTSSKQRWRVLLRPSVSGARSDGLRRARLGLAFMLLPPCARGRLVGTAAQPAVVSKTTNDPVRRHELADHRHRCDVNGWPEPWAVFLT